MIKTKSPRVISKSNYGSSRQQSKLTHAALTKLSGTATMVPATIYGTTQLISVPPANNLPRKNYD